MNSTIGWNVTRGQNDGDVRLERIAGVSPLEGTYKCAVDRSSVSIDEGIDTVTVYLYWPCKFLKLTLVHEGLSLYWHVDRTHYLPIQEKEN